MANGNQPVAQLNDLRGPMGKKLSKIQRQLRELQRYKEMFGALSGSDDDTDSDDTEREGGGRSSDGDDEGEEEV
jgi:adenylate cyclase